VIGLEPLKIDVQIEFRQRCPNQTCKYRISNTSNLNAKTSCYRRSAKTSST
jgi:hypothetical protein